MLKGAKRTEHLLAFCLFVCLYSCAIHTSDFCCCSAFKVVHVSWGSLSIATLQYRKIVQLCSSFSSDQQHVRVLHAFTEQEECTTSVKPICSSCCCKRTHNAHYAQ